MGIVGEVGVRAERRSHAERRVSRFLFRFEDAFKALVVRVLLHESYRFALELVTGPSKEVLACLIVEEDED